MYPAVHAQTTPDKPAVIMGSGEVVTYRQLNDRSNQCAQLFASLGLVKDDAIALFMMNCPEYFYAAWGHTWLMTGGTVEGFDAFEARLDVLTPAPLPREMEGCVMLYSSGTTGYPKGIRNANPERAIGDPGPLMQGIMSSFGTTAETVYLSPAPLYHAATEGHGGTQISSDEWLSHIKRPKSIDFEAKLPRSDAGKLFKRKIRDRYWQGRDSAII